MTEKEALEFLENHCLMFMAQIQRANRPKILEAADILRKLLPKEKKKKEEKKEKEE